MANLHPKGSHALCLVLVLVLGSLLLPARGTAADTLVIRAEKVYTATKGTIEHGVIVIENGKIVRIGTAIETPPGAREITAKAVIPGLIDLHSHMGVYPIPLVEENYDGNEATNPVTPQVRAFEGFDFDDLSIPPARAAGVTTVISRPGSLNVICGTSVAVKLKNAPPQEMVLKEDADLKMAYEGNPSGYYANLKQMPSTVMAVYAVARKAFIEAQEYQKTWEKYEADKKRGLKPTSPKKDFGNETLVRVLKREMPVHIHVYTPSETMSAIRLADEFNLRLSLGHCDKTYLIIDELAKRKDIYFNVGPALFDTYYQNSLDFANVPAILAQAGLKVSLQMDGSAEQLNLRESAALCVRYGMSEDDALRSITINAAEAVDLGGRIGSLEAGKDADLVLLDGAPFELLTSVETVIIDGRVEYQKDPAAVSVVPPSRPPATNPLRLPPQVKASGQYAIRGGLVYTMAGDPLENGVVLVKDGKIEKVGRGLPIPDGIPVVDAGDRVVMPGLVLARTQAGLTSNWRMQSSTDEISKPITPEIEAKHAVEPQAPHFYLLPELGVTSALVTPGDLNVIGGRGLALKTRGDVVDRMLIKDQAVMIFGLGSKAKRKQQMPSTRMGIAALLRETLVRAQQYRDALDASKKDKKAVAPPRDLQLEALVPVVKGEMPVFIHCERRDDIMTALRLVDEFGLKAVLTGATEAYTLVDEIKKRGIPVILDNVFRGVGNIEDAGFSDANPAVLAKAGIPLAFQAKEGLWQWPAAGMEGGDLLEMAAFACRHGMPEDAALRAVTIDAARIAGIGSRVGSLEPGKDADILILRGHPFRTASIADAVFLDGKLVYERDKSAAGEKSDR